MRINTRLSSSVRICPSPKTYQEGVRPRLTPSKYLIPLVTRPPPTKQTQHAHHYCSFRCIAASGSWILCTHVISTPLLYSLLSSATSTLRSIRTTSETTLYLRYHSYPTFRRSHYCCFTGLPRKLPSFHPRFAVRSVRCDAIPRGVNPTLHKFQHIDQGPFEFKAPSEREP